MSVYDILIGDMEMKRINITLTEGHLKALKRISDKSGYSVSDLIRRALDSYFSDMFEWYEEVIYEPQKDNLEQ